MRFTRAVLCIFVLVIISSTASLAQITSATSDQAPPYPGTGYNYLGGQVYTIDPQQGTLSVKLALPIV